jgi:hypothetical protein
VARNLCVFGAARLLLTLAAGDNRAAVARVAGRCALDASCDVAHKALSWCAALWEETLHSHTLRENGGEARLVVSDKPWPATQLSPEHDTPLYLFSRSASVSPFALLQQQSARSLQRALLADDLFLDGIMASVAIGLAGTVAAATTATPSTTAAAAPTGGAVAARSSALRAGRRASLTGSDAVMDLFSSGGIARDAALAADARSLAASAAGVAPDDEAAVVAHAQVLGEALALLTTMASDVATAPMLKAQLRAAHWELLAVVVATPVLSDELAAAVRDALSALLGCLGRDNALADQLLFRVVDSARTVAQSPAWLPSRDGVDAAADADAVAERMSRTALAVTARCLIRAATGQRPRAPRRRDAVVARRQAWVALLHSLSSEAFGSEGAEPTRRRRRAVSAEQLPLFLFTFHAIDSDERARRARAQCASKLVTWCCSWRSTAARRCSASRRRASWRCCATCCCTRAASAELGAAAGGAGTRPTRCAVAERLCGGASASATTPCALASLDAHLLGERRGDMALMGSAPGELVRRLAQLMTAALASPDAAWGGLLAEHCWQLVSALSLCRASSPLRTAAAERLPVLDLLRCCRQCAPPPTTAPTLARVADAPLWSRDDAGRLGPGRDAPLRGAVRRRRVADRCAGERARCALAPRWLRAARRALREPTLPCCACCSCSAAAWCAHRRVWRSPTRRTRPTTPIARWCSTRHRHRRLERARRCCGALGDGQSRDAGDDPPCRRRRRSTALVPLGLRRRRARGDCCTCRCCSRRARCPSRRRTACRVAARSYQVALWHAVLRRLGASAGVARPTMPPSLLLLERSCPLAQLPPTSRHAARCTICRQCTTSWRCRVCARFELAPLRAWRRAVQTRVRGALVGPLRSVCRSMLLYANAPRGRVDLQWFFAVAEPTLRVPTRRRCSTCCSPAWRAAGRRARRCARARLMLCHLLLTATPTTRPTS